MDFLENLQADTYCIKNGGYAIIITDGKKDGLISALYYSDIHPIVQDGMLIYEKDNLYIYKFSRLDYYNIEDFKQIMSSRHMKKKNYDSQTFSKLFRLKKTVKFEGDPTESHRLINTCDDDAEEVFQNEHYVIYKNAKYKPKRIPNTNFPFINCYKLVFLKIKPLITGWYHPGTYVRDSVSRKSGFYFDQDQYDLADVKKFADEEVNKYLARKTKQSSVIRQIVRIARTIMNTRY